MTDRMRYFAVAEIVLGGTGGIVSMREMSVGDGGSTCQYGSIPAANTVLRALLVFSDTMRSLDRGIMAAEPCGRKNVSFVSDHPKRVLVPLPPTHHTAVTAHIHSGLHHTNSLSQLDFHLTTTNSTIDRYHELLSKPLETSDSIFGLRSAATL
jgi:hypothetical protein